MRARARTLPVLRLQKCMFEVNFPWDPLKLCVVGKSYPPEFYQWIDNARLRTCFERIAQETEEDLKNLVAVLEKLDVKVIRPDIPEFPGDMFYQRNIRLPGPVSMTPRDGMMMIGSKFYEFSSRKHVIKASGRINQSNWTPDVFDKYKTSDWPKLFCEWYQLPKWIQYECQINHGFIYRPGDNFSDLAMVSEKLNWWESILEHVQAAGNPIYRAKDYPSLDLIEANGITRLGNELYFGWKYPRERNVLIEETISKHFADYKCHMIWTGGHVDGTFCPVVPGLIVSTADVQNHNEYFPDWEVVWLPNENWNKVQGWIELKRKNNGRWWIKEAHNDPELVEFVETWLQDWTGYCEESVFDVNMLVVDKKNVIIHAANDQVINAFNRYDITAHVCPLRHRYFWDGGIHCMTLDLDRKPHL